MPMPFRRRKPAERTPPFDIRQVPAPGPTSAPPGPETRPETPVPAAPPVARPQRPTRPAPPVTAAPPTRRPERRPLPVTPIPPADAPRPAPAGPGAPPPAPAGRPVFLARFEAGAVGAVLAFVGATPGPEGAAGYPAAEGRCRRDPGDGSVWVTATLPGSGALTVTASLVATLGGTAFESRGGRLVRLAGRHPVPPTDPGTLPPVHLPRLVATLIPAGRPQGPFTEIAVVTTGGLARAIVRRWQRAGAEVTIAQLLREPLDSPPGQDTQEAVLIQARSAAGRLPGPAVAALTDLPHTVVCREAGRVLIDVRFALPVDDRQLTAEVPAGQSWIIGGADSGAWRITSRGPAVTPALALAVPAPPALAEADGQAAGAHAAGPQPGRPAPDHTTPVRVIPMTRPDGRADAVLLDDAELGRLRRFLARSTLADTAFLVLGPGRHLLTEPAGLLEPVPFGVPLHRIGPGGLYLEAGHTLDPPVPLTARPELFRLDGESIVVICTDGSWRLALSAMRPAWCLWAGEMPEAESGLSEHGRELLARLSPFEVPAAAVAAAAGTAGQSGPVLARGQLLDEAERLEQRGKLAEAARRLEESGELYRAALLYERAARESAERRG